MNVIDFIRESAVFMSVDRPDIYSPDLAVRELTEAIEVLRQADKEYGCVMFTSYVLSRIFDDGVEEFLLTRKLSSVLVCEDEQACLVFAFTPEVNLPSVFDGDPDQGLDDDDDSW